MNSLARVAIVGWVLAGAAGTAAGYPLEKGRTEVRPLLGSTAGIDGQPNQGQIGVDGAWGLGRERSFVLGGWVGFAEGYLGVQIHAGVKHRFTRLHPRIVPFFTIGGGVTAGFFTSGSEPVTGVGLRFGGGVEVFATPRILPGLQIIFDLGPRFTPSFGLLGSAQITVGCTFLL